MPAIAPLSPEQLLAEFQQSGWQIIDEGTYHWVVAPDDESEPFLIPKSGDNIGFDLMAKARGVLNKPLLPSGIKA